MDRRHSYGWHQWLYAHYGDNELMGSMGQVSFLSNTRISFTLSFYLPHDRSIILEEFILFSFN